MWHISKLRARSFFISGLVARNEKGETVGIGSLEDQTRQVYRNISIVLESLGTSFNSIIKQNIYTTKLDQVVTIRKVRDEFFKCHKDSMPASTLIGVTGLVSPDLLIEIEAAAALGSK
jgi:2-iminobutanoate/2-iminopropanoate deaminase